MQTATMASYTSNTLTMNYANGAIIVIPTGVGISSNYTLNITGIPPSVVGDTTKTYVVSVINTNGSSVTVPNNTMIANAVNINGTSISSVVYAGGVTSLPTTTSTYLIQQVAIITVNGSTTIALSNVSQYS